MPRDPSHIGDALGPYLARLGMPDVTSVVDLRDRWSAIAGSPWDTWSEPVTIEGDVLIVRASSPTVVRPLRYAVGDLIRRCDEALGSGIVTSVRVVPPT